ncbi:MAG: LPS export ABC transporter permease LptF [Deltaproteobacteria bacterium RBG_13_58_19]|nr:MAG: LPS export ABC transporter permease LptF [Deltaproteobacteria bacterium RBG_13_58_19]
MPRIIYRYLLLETIHPCAVSLLAFTSIVFSGRLMRITQMIVVKGIGLMEILESTLYLLPYLLVFTLPMAGTVGIMLALMRLTVDHEIIALKTAGLSYGQLVLPIVGFSLATGLVTLFLTVSGSPWGQKATRELLTDIVKRRADLGIKEQTFNTDFQGMMLFVNRVTGEAGRLEGVFVYDSRDEENPHTVYAQKGELSFDPKQETLQLNLLDGWVIRWDPEQDRRQTIRFKTYQLPLQLFSFTLKGSKSEGEMYLPDLYQALRSQPPGSERYNRLMVELSQRLSMPFGAFLLCLLAIPLGLSARQHARTRGLILGLIVFLIYYVVFTASWRLAVNDRLNPALAPWIPNLLCLLIGFYFWSRTLKELPLLPGSWLFWRRLPFRGKLWGQRR